MVRKWIVLMIAIMLLANGCRDMGDRRGPSDIGGTVFPASGSADGRDDIEVSRIAYAVDGQADPQQNYGELFVRKNAEARTLPVVMLIHGGGWGSRFGVHTLDGFARTLAEHGVAVFNIEYRRVGTGGGWPTTFTDATAAYDAATVLSSTHPQLRTSPIVVVGHSAGAQLATLTATDFGLPDRRHTRPRPAAVIALAGAVDMADAARSGSVSVTRALGGSPRRFPLRYRVVDPISTINPLVPTTLIHGDDDRIVPYRFAVNYVREADRRNADVRLVTVAGGTHPSVVTPGGLGYATTMRVILAAALRD